MPDPVLHSHCCSVEIGRLQYVTRMFFSPLSEVSCALACSSLSVSLRDLPGFFMILNPAVQSSHNGSGFRCMDVENDVYADVLSAVCNAA